MIHTIYIARHSREINKSHFYQIAEKSWLYHFHGKTDSHILRKEISAFWILPLPPINPPYRSSSLTKTPFTQVQIYYQYTFSCTSKQPQIQRFYTSYNTVTVQCTWYKTPLCSFVANPIVPTKLVFHNSRNGLRCYVYGTTVGFLF